MIADKLYILLAVVVISTFQAGATEDFREYVYEIEHSFAAQMLNEFDLRWKGDMGRMRGKVELMGMNFLTYRRATIEEARTLELLVIDKLVQAINAHEKIQHYLDIIPFSAKRVTIGINFEGVNGRNSDGSITYIFNVSDLAITSYKNHIVYCSHDPFKDDLIDELDEPYEEAVRINAASAVDPAIHQGNEYEDEMDTLLASFSEEVYKKFGLSVWSIGGKWINGIKEVGAKFVLNQFVTNAEARQLLVEVTEKLLSAINSNEKVRPYLKEYPFPAGLLKLRFCIEKKGHNEFPDVRMESMTLNENLITYVQEILHPKEEGEVFRDSEKIVLATESYPEALKIVEDNPLEFNRQNPSFFNNLKDWFAKLLAYVYSF